MTERFYVTDEPLAVGERKALRLTIEHYKREFDASQKELFDVIASKRVLQADLTAAIKALSATIKMLSETAQERDRYLALAECECGDVPAFPAPGWIPNMCPNCQAEEMSDG